MITRAQIYPRGILHVAWQAEGRDCFSFASLETLFLMPEFRPVEEHLWEHAECLCIVLKLPQVTSTYRTCNMQKGIQVREHGTQEASSKSLSLLEKKNTHTHALPGLLSLAAHELKDKFSFQRLRLQIRAFQVIFQNFKGVICGREGPVPSCFSKKTFENLPHSGNTWAIGPNTKPLSCSRHIEGNSVSC